MEHVKMKIFAVYLADQHTVYFLILSCKLRVRFSLLNLPKMCRNLFHTHLTVWFLSWNFWGLPSQTYEEIWKENYEGECQCLHELYSTWGQIIQIIKYTSVYLQLFVTQESSGNSTCAGFDGKADTTVVTQTSHCTWVNKISSYCEALSEVQL